eukprot:11168279-Lingulodinium_polyedra.AAC.1
MLATETEGTSGRRDAGCPAPAQWQRPLRPHQSARPESNIGTPSLLGRRCRRPNGSARPRG